MPRNTENIDLHDVPPGDSVQFLSATVTQCEKFAPLGKLTSREFDLIKSKHGWMKDTIIHQAQVLLKKQNHDFDGLKRPPLGPCRYLNVVSTDFIQILHTQNSHWVCVSLVGCPQGEINLYDSLYSYLITNKISEQIKSLLGGKEHTLVVAPVQQQGNGSDWGVFAIAFATCLAHYVEPITVDFDIPKMIPRLISCFKSEFLSFFPVL